MKGSVELTPRQIVEELDRYIIEQQEAKRAVAIAIRNRWRRQQVEEALREEIYPKNIIMIGPTGVGKTEIARRIAKLIKAPFLKVEASKFTEVGYVGRDVESMVRDLTEIGVNQVRQEHEEQVVEQARKNAMEKVLDRLIPPPPKPPKTPEPPDVVVEADPRQAPVEGETFVMSTPEDLHVLQESYQRTRNKMRELLMAGKLDDREIEVEVADRSKIPMIEIFSGSGLEEMDINFKDMFGNLFPKKTKHRKIKVSEALRMLEKEEAHRLIDMDKVLEEALYRVQHNGIIFLDELDKIAGREKGHGPDVSREGVQRDLLPIVEGSTVITKHGIVQTDHILFIAAGAFNVAKPADLIPELQGRFPIRVELKALTSAAFVRILTEPKNALTKQYEAMLETEGVTLTYTIEGVRRIADLAAKVNEKTENIGARRLATIMERLLDEISFNAPEMKGAKVKIDAKFVDKALSDIIEDEDLSRFIL